MNVPSRTFNMAHVLHNSRLPSTSLHLAFSFSHTGLSSCLEEVLELISVPFDKEQVSRF